MNEQAVSSNPHSGLSLAVVAVGGWRSFHVQTQGIT